MSMSGKNKMDSTHLIGNHERVSKNIMTGEKALESESSEVEFWLCALRAV